eukprot:scaffold7782_cov113-Isochrysis_galbana.AAC.4
MPGGPEGGARKPFTSVGWRGLTHEEGPPADARGGFSHVQRRVSLTAKQSGSRQRAVAGSPNQKNRPAIVNDDGGVRDRAVPQGAHPTETG